MKRILKFKESIDTSIQYHQYLYYIDCSNINNNIKKYVPYILDKYGLSKIKVQVENFLKLNSSFNGFFVRLFYEYDTLIDIGFYVDRYGFVIGSEKFEEVLKFYKDHYNIKDVEILKIEDYEIASVKYNL